MALTKKRRKFIQEYLKDFNATQAAKRAGYSERTAYSQGSRLLKIVEIADEIDGALMSPREIRARIDKIARDGETDATKLRALELAGKAVSLFTEKVELSGGDGGPLELEIQWPEDQDADAYTASGADGGIQG